MVPHRGTNTEVSLPAGPLCAEFASIGRAAYSLERASDILVVATAELLKSYVQKRPWYPEEHREKPDAAHDIVVRCAQCVGGKRNAA